MADIDHQVRIKFNGDTSNFDKALKSTQNSLGSLKAMLVKLGLGAVLTKGVKEAVTATNQFEASIAKASTLFGSVAVDTANLSQQILNLSSATGQSADSIGNSLYNALSAGVKVTEDMGEAMAFMEASTKLSVAGFTDVDTAVTATAKVINAYGMSLDEAGRVGEVLMETQNLGITTVNELGGALATVTPVASSFGVAFEQVGASLAVMTKQGTDTATATTQLRGMITELGQSGTTASKNLQSAFKRAGLEYKNFAEYMANGGDLQGAVRLLAEEAEATGLSMSDMFSNIRAGMGALQLAGDEFNVFGQFMQDMAGDSQLVEDAYNKMMDTRTKSWATLKEELKNITIKITQSEASQRLLDNLLGLAQKLVDKVDELAPNIERGVNKAYLACSILFRYIKDNIEALPLILASALGGISLAKTLFSALGIGFGDAGLGLLAIAISMKLADDPVEFGTRLATALAVGIGIGTFLGSPKAGVLAFAIAISLENETNPEEFGAQLIGALATGIGIGVFTGSPKAGALGFTVMLSLEMLIGRNAQKVRDDAQQAIDAQQAFEETIADNEDKLAKERQRIAKLYADNWVKYNKDALLSSESDFEEFIENIRRNAVEVGADPDVIEAYGRNIVDGLAIGTNGASDLGSQVGQELLDGFADTLGIHSPSKAFEELGEYIIQGLEQGMTSSELSNAQTELSDAFFELGENISKALADGFDENGQAYGILDALRDYSAGSKLYGSLGKSLQNATPVSAPASSTSRGSNTEISISPAEDEQKISRLKGLRQAMAQYASSTSSVATSMKDLFDTSTGMIDAEGELTAKGEFWGETMNTAISTMLSGFSALGEDIVEGEAGWDDFAKAGLEALASILEALGYQLASMAVSTYPNFAQMALSAGASALAFTGAGIVRGFAGKFENGGIVGGSGITGDRHMIFANAGELILNKAQQTRLAGQLGGSRAPEFSIAFNGNVFGDQQTISEYVYEGIKTAQREGAINAW